MNKQTWLKQYASLINSGFTNYPIGNLQFTSSGNTNFPNMMPLSMKIASQTIGFDMVSVKPLKGPIGNIFGMDFKYEEDEEAKRRRLLRERLEKINKILRKLKIEKILQELNNKNYGIKTDN